MQRALKFYRDGLGYETDCKEDNPPVCFFNTPGTKFELYPLDAPAARYQRKRSAQRQRICRHHASKKAGGTIVKEPQDTFWGGYRAILPILTDTTERWLGGPVLNLKRTG
nr:hypothetical protein [uncultured Campylobacter sp.]